jgi:hypothetical protein
MELPIRIPPLSEKELPKFPKSRQDILEATINRELTDKEDPIETFSDTDRHDPATVSLETHNERDKTASPRMSTPDPKQDSSQTETEEVKTARSLTDNPEFIAVFPPTEIKPPAKPSLATDTLFPRAAKSPR